MTSRIPDGRDVTQSDITKVKAIHDLAKKLIDQLDLPWEVEYDDYDPAQYPGIRVSTGGMLYVSINYDYHDQHEYDWGWMVYALVQSHGGGPPEPPQELIDGISERLSEALADAFGALLQYEVRATINDLYIMHPRFAEVE